MFNSFGFVDEYNTSCPVDLSFQQEYARRALKADHGLITMQKDADSLPVPEHSTVDVFTDRWPENHAAQDTMIADVRLFLGQLAVLLDDRRPLRDRRDILKAMFGEDVGQLVVDELERDIGEAIRTGRHGFGALGGLAMSPTIVRAKPAVKPSTFYGTKWRSS